MVVIDRLTFHASKALAPIADRHVGRRFRRRIRWYVLDGGHFQAVATERAPNAGAGGSCRRRLDHANVDVSLVIIVQRVRRLRRVVRIVAVVARLSRFQGQTGRRPGPSTLGRRAIYGCVRSADRVAARALRPYHFGYGGSPSARNWFAAERGGSAVKRRFFRILLLELLEVNGNPVDDDRTRMGRCRRKRRDIDGSAGRRAAIGQTTFPD